MVDQKKNVTKGQKKYFGLVSGAQSTHKLVKIHNTWVGLNINQKRL